MPRRAPRWSKPASRARTTSKDAEPSWRSASPCSRENKRPIKDAVSQKRRRSMKLIIALAAALAMAVNATAQTYPTRPVTVVVGFAPGGGTDTVARVMQRKLGEYLGQSIVVENRAGAGRAAAAAAGREKGPRSPTRLVS